MELNAFITSVSNKKYKLNIFSNNGNNHLLYSKYVGMEKCIASMLNKIKLFLSQLNYTFQYSILIIIKFFKIIF